MLLSNKKEQTTETLNMDETPKHYAKWKSQKTTQIVRFQLYEILEKTECNDRKQISSCQ